MYCSLYISCTSCLNAIKFIARKFINEKFVSTNSKQRWARDVLVVCIPLLEIVSYFFWNLTWSKQKHRCAEVFLFTRLLVVVEFSLAFHKDRIFFRQKSMKLVSLIVEKVTLLTIFNPFYNVLSLFAWWSQY